MLNIIKAIATLLTIASVVLVVYAIYTSTYYSFLFWAIYAGIVILALTLINYIKKYDQEEMEK